MAYTLKTQIANKANYGKYRETSKIKYIVIHYTSNDGDTDENNGKYFANNIIKASAHYFVDDDSVTQSVPDDYVAWSVGGGKYSNCNKTGGGKYHGICTNTNSISIELCDAHKNGIIYATDKTIANALELTQMLMKKYNVPKENVIRHFDVTGKYCPTYWCGSSVRDNKWKTEFWNKLTDIEDNTPEKVTPTYTLKDFVCEVQSAIGAKIDGIAGKETISKTVTVSATINRKHTVVKAIQRRLNSLGYNCGKVDGIAGTKFTNAVKSYQRAKKCVVDGEVTARCKTWRYLLGMS